jgi:hypothetical protein
MAESFPKTPNTKGKPDCRSNKNKSAQNPSTQIS